MTYQKLINTTGITSLAAAVLCIVLMCGYAYHFPDTESKDARLLAKENASENRDETVLDFKEQEGAVTMITLSESGWNRNCYILEDMIGKRIIIYDMDPSMEADIVTDPVFCNRITQNVVENFVSLELSLTDYYEIAVQQMDDQIIITYFRPGTSGNPVIILAPEQYEGDWDIPLEIAGKMRDSLQMEGYSVYLTRVDDKFPSEADKKLLTEKFSPALYLEISYGESMTYATYNENYYLRKYDNAMWAYEVEQGVISLTGEENCLSTELSEESVLQYLKIPSAGITLSGATVSEKNTGVNWQTAYCNQLSEAMSEVVKKAMTVISPEPEEKEK